VDKQQKLKIAVPILAVIMFFVWKPVLMGSGSKSKGNSDKNAGPAPPAVGLTGISQSDLAMLLNTSQKKKARSTYTEWNHNPFVLGQKQEALMVEGILWDNQSPKVMINGNILGTGEKIGDVTVMDIKTNSVVLKDAEGEFELSPGESK
jgi:hypothetical protein